MTSHSEHGFYVRGVTQRLVAGEFVDTGAAREVVNNLQHLYDESTRHVVNIVRPVGQYIEQSDPSATEYRRVDGLPPLVFPITMFPDTSATIVVRMIGYVSSGAATCTWRLRLSLHGDVVGAAPIIDASRPDTAEIGTSSTSPTALTAALRLYGWAERVHRGASDPRRYPGGVGLRSWPSLDGNGDLSSSDMLMAQLEVWAISTQTASKPRISALMAREYVGT